MRILAVDHGSKRLGLAISDPTGTIAAPLMVLQHTGREADTAKVAELVREHGVGLVVVGQSLGDDGQPNPAGRSAGRFAEALRARIEAPVVMWDEAFSTQEARRARVRMGVPRKKRRGHLDELAAVLILQSYLETRPPEE
jgi:putative holliday junction resolvase